MEIAGFDPITRPELRRMAEAIHRCYEDAAGSGGATPFSALDPALKASNEDAAAHGDIKLDCLGWTRVPLAPEESAGEGPIPTAEQIEHNRWMGERLSSGWRYGQPRRRPENRRRLSLVAWERLADAEERAKDEMHVRSLLAIYREIGYKVGALDSDPAGR